LFRGDIIIKIENRVHRLTVAVHFIMTMGTSAFTCITILTDNFSPFNFLTRFYFDLKHMAKKSGIPITIMNHYMITVAVPGVTGGFNSSIGGCIDGCTLGRGNIQTSMKFGRFVNRIYTVSQTGGNSFEIFVTYRLNSWCTGQEQFFVFNEVVYFVVGFGLRMDPGSQAGQEFAIETARFS
jgi:hypothetical protein